MSVRIYTRDAHEGLTCFLCNAAQPWPETSSFALAQVDIDVVIRRDMRYSKTRLAYSIPTVDNDAWQSHDIRQWSSAVDGLGGTY